MTAADLLVALALYGFDSGLVGPRRMMIRPLALAFTAPQRFRRDTRPSRDIELDASAADLLKAAAAVAVHARHRVIDTEHVLVAALARPAREVRPAGGWDRWSPT